MSGAPDVDYTATSLRPDWNTLPPALHESLAVALGTEITAAAPPVGSGFTGGFAAPIQLADGRRVFVKAADDTMHAYHAYQREAEVVPQLPSADPRPSHHHHRPRCRWTPSRGRQAAVVCGGVRVGGGADAGGAVDGRRLRGGDRDV